MTTKGIPPHSIRNASFNKRHTTSIRGTNHTGDMTTDYDLLSKEATRILTLVLWSPSLVDFTMLLVFPWQREVTDQEQEEQESRRPKESTIFRSPFQVLLGPPGFPSNVMDGLATNSRMTMWYHVYFKHPQVDNNRFQALFRRRFRVPRSSFLSINTELENCPQFVRWHNSKQDCFRVRASPISMLLLSVLRYLGQSWTMDDLHEATCISEDVICTFSYSSIP